MSDPAPDKDTPEEAVVQQNASATLISGIGANLRAQREARSWTIEHVANQLNLAPRQVRALEDDDYAALPGMAVTRGFIRAYAKLVKIDPAPLMAIMPAAVPPQTEDLQHRPSRTTPFSEGGRLSSGGNSPLRSRVMISMLLLILLLGGAYIAYHFGLVRIPAAGVFQLDEATPPSAASPATEVSESVVLGAPSLGIENSDGVINADTAQRESGSQVGAGNVLAAGQGDTAPASSNSLVIKLREDSWVEIKRLESVKGANDIIHSRLMKAGTEQAFDLTAPVIVTVGNATGVDATWRGEPLDIKTGMKNNVARLTLK